MRRNAVRSGAVALVALALLAPSARAQGFGIYEGDACTMGRAGTGVARPCNASAVFYNPAGIISPTNDRWNIAIGGVMISPKFAFKDSVSGVTTNSVSNNIPVPNIYITHQQHSGSTNWAMGLGVFAPYGLISEWPVTPPPGFAGRFLGYRSELKSLYIQPTIAVEVNHWLSLGAGFDYIWTSVDLKQRVDLSSQLAAGTTTFAQLGIPLGTDFADARLTGKGTSAGGHFGVIIKPTSRLSLGARYLMRVHANVQGNAVFTQLPTGIVLAAGNPLGVPGGTPLDSVLAPKFRTGPIFGHALNDTLPIGSQHASTIVAQPDQLVLGAAYNVTRELTALVDYQWVNWSQFDSLTITFLNLPKSIQYEDYRNTSGWRFGLQYEQANFTLRGGYLHHDGAAPDQTVTPLLPEGARSEWTLGAGIKLGRNGRLDVAYQNISQQDHRGRVVNAPRGSTAFNTGLYTGSATLFGASLTWGF